MRSGRGLSRFLAELFWFEQPLHQLEAERRQLIEARRRAVQLHRPVAEIDAKLGSLTRAALRKRRRAWA